MEAIERVRQFIERWQLMEADKRYLVGVSGGADSVCLLLMLQQLGYQLEAVHCNFKLRGEESERDEAFVVNLCNHLGVNIHLIHFDTIGYAELHQVSIEMAARELRYGYFEQLLVDLGAAGICVAHHQDDSVETVLMNLMRGTGIHGLCGIRPRRGHVLRPLLCLSRLDIESWLQQQGQDYVTDSSNLSADITRNYLRLKVLPLMREQSPTVSKQILDTAHRLSEAALVYDQAIRESLTRLVSADSIEISRLLQEPSPESILFEWLTPYGFTPAVIESISDRLNHLKSGRVWSSATHELTVSQNHLIIKAVQPTHYSLVIPEPGTYIYDETERFRFRMVDGPVIERNPRHCSLEASKVTFPLTIRPVQMGDVFQPFGMKGRKLVSDYLCDMKMNVLDRRQQLVVTDKSGAIIWLVGLRPDERFKVDSNTKQTLVIEF